MKLFQSEQFFCSCSLDFPIHSKEYLPKINIHAVNGSRLGRPNAGDSLIKSILNKTFTNIRTGIGIVYRGIFAANSVKLSTATAKLLHAIMPQPPSVVIQTFI